MSSTSSKRRNTNNSQCASLLSTDMSAVGKPSETLDSDDESDEDDGMSSAGDISEHTKRPRTPRGRYSPDAQRRTNSRLTMSALSIDTHRAADLNVDGSGPSSSSAASHVQFTPDPDRLPTSHRKKGPQSAIRSRKRRSPSVPVSQDDDDDSDTQDEETDDLPIVIDDLGYSITEEAREFFNRAKGDVAEEWHFSPKYLAEVYGSLKEGEQARLPEKMHFGKYIMRTWYGSPFPAEYIKVKMMYVCEFCMFYARSDEIMQNHAKKCEIRAPPGIEIYRRDNVSVFEVDGRKQKGYCQTLCLVSRMFLESKTVFYDTEPFFFYVVTMNDEYGCHFAGYFSKEKYEPDVNNLSCIMTLPCYQEQGFGRFLIDVSYALSRKEEWNGGPEQPLSDLGRKAYGGYWRTAVSISLAHFKNHIENGSGVSINMIANHTGINSHDVLEVIGALGWAKPVNTGDTIHDIEWDVDWDMVDMIKREAKASKKIQFHEDCLDWEPRKMKPSMDGYHELTKEEIEEDEIKRKNNLQKTPVRNSESMQLATPTSSSMPVGSVKKELRSRGHNRSVGRNLKLELPKIKVPEPIEGKEVTDEEDEKRKLQKKIKKTLTRCSG
ncbi:hypothetical protein CAEBREN_26418 [Caenorhabditis brenneri]|uniref:histone acetyltransferase n=1 Tax=Caenorhabditis brenneri TaxID=135651 RepID=G0NV22_CAEBE|nr:hypothetical protein CAEBREN_26418 [Caenorhabditis brenneri]